ncbi:response regulator transcription factor [Streptacidiphilus sp. P02-A3a]|uniref:response regulator transcription factor n=1 Tax=Streptacidiphilus sp. P02-A3a TaxID=2704468 RepID=UPI0015FBC888|nr:LuxR C-terminal-related transcriptional regulator [Streptacidiphilus sp. P02-A3a]QMU71244.1 response regulator transcription factor [Streptacidiphilus sp. P02-A3a]
MTRTTGFPDWSREAERAALLSAREREVFLLLGAGCCNRKISARLDVTERTVKAHVASIMAKLQVESRLQAGLVAQSHWSLLDNGTTDGGTDGGPDGAAGREDHLAQSSMAEGSIHLPGKTG